MQRPKIMLIRPDRAYRRSFLKAFREIDTDAERRAWAYLPKDAPLEAVEDDFEGYVAGLLARETVAPEGFVCDTVYWGLLDAEIVGRIAVRHTLNDFLERLGGHIGYIVRPSHRGKGLAAEMLRQVLNTEKARAIGRLLVTCDEENIASEKTIVKNGGVFESVIDNEPGFPRKKRFWIDLRGGSAPVREQRL